MPRALIFRGPGRYLEAYGYRLEVGDLAPFSDSEISALEAQGLRFEAADASSLGVLWETPIYHEEPEADIGEGQPIHEHEKEG